MGSTYVVQYRNWTIPGAGSANAMIAPFWDNLYQDAGSGLFVKHDEVEHRWIVEWSRFRGYSAQLETFQVILYDPAYHVTETGDGIIGSYGVRTLLTDPDVRRYNVDSMAGVDYRIDPTRAEGDRVRDLRYQGVAIDVHQTFTLVCNNYRAAGGGHFPHLDSAEVVWTSSKEVAEQIGEHLERSDPWVRVELSNELQAWLKTDGLRIVYLW